MSLERLKKVFENISNSQRLPLVFAGSGISKRYTTNRYDWKGLLIRCIEEYCENPVNKYNEYREEVKYSLSIEDESKFTINEKIGSLVERDFNTAYYRNEILNLDVQDNQSPLKVFIAKLLSDYELLPEMKNEIELFKSLKEKMITIITTNYDTFFEDNIFTKHEKIIGQQIFKKSELGSIMKIHGCITEPDSIVLTSRDYKKFFKKRKVLSAKIINLFTENPVIFMGYSLSDENIKSILIDIFECLESEEEYKKFEERLIIVVYDENIKDPVVGTHSMLIDGVTITMTKITLSDFTPLLIEMNKLKRITRLRDIQHIKDLVFEIVNSTNGEEKKLVNLLGDDEDYDGNEVVVAITKKTDIVNLIGVKPIDREDIIRDIVFNDLPNVLNKQWIIEYTLPNELKRNAYLPVHKYLSNIDLTDVQIDKRIKELANKNEGDLLNNSIKKHSEMFNEMKFKSLEEIYNSNVKNWRKMPYLVLYAVTCSSSELREFLEKRFYELYESNFKTYLNKLVMFLDIKENKK